MFTKGETVVCVLNHRAPSLTIGKDYKVVDTYGDFVSVVCDDDYSMDYSKDRFLSKGEYRGLITNQILD